MAKRATRNLAQLRKDNRTSTLPLVCSTKKCDCDFFISRSNPAKRVCAEHWSNPPQGRKDKQIAKLKSMGLL